MNKRKVYSCYLRPFSKYGLILFMLLALVSSSIAQGTRLLREPDISGDKIVFAYASDLWVSDLSGDNMLRLTSTSAVESNPYFSPDGKWIAFTSNKNGGNDVYMMSVDGGEAKRMTWHPDEDNVRGWTLDGKRILFASNRMTPPSRYNRLWTVSIEGGAPELLSKQWATSGSFSADGKKIAIDRMRRWDLEWRAYRGGQNTPLIIMDLEDWSEILLPNEKTTDTHPIWVGDDIYFLSDRDFVKNIWKYSIASKSLTQITKFEGSDIKHITVDQNTLAFERDGYLHLLDLTTQDITQLNFNVRGDFPWAEKRWEDVSRNARNVSLSPTGKRAIMEARGEIFTVPVENGDTRNITQSSGSADRCPIWSPKGDKLAWFSDANGKGYSLMIADQNGLSKPEAISIGESKFAWEPVWSPDGKFIAFVDDDVRLRIVNLETKVIFTAEVGGNNLERGNVGLNWSYDSKWLAFTKTASNSFRQVLIWSQDQQKVIPLTNHFADSFSPVWDRDEKHLYFLASTDVALGSGWANTSAMTADPVYGAYVVNLQKEVASPFKPKSDEESVKKEKKDTDSKSDSKKKSKDKSDKKEEAKEESMKIDFDGIDRRILALSIPARNYAYLVAGSKGSLFIAERIPNSRGFNLKKYSLEDNEAKEYASGASQISVSADGKKILARLNGSWKVMNTARPNGKDGKRLKVSLKMHLDRKAEWKQMFEEAWRYQRDYFYDPDMHGRDWNVVYKRYAPLVPFIKHRSDLTYILDQVNGELSVGHSFVFGGDFPKTERARVGMLGANLIQDKGYWKIERIFTTESWNPGLNGPLDQPGMKIKEGYYIVGVNGKELTADDNPYEFLDGTSGLQTVLHINKKNAFEGSWKETVKPIRSERALRQRAWVEDNRRMVDKLSDGKLAYIWVPNTAGPGFVSFNRYFFAQQDKLGAVIDERFNGGGFLDDYMVDLMTREVRAALTNEVPNGKAMRLPAGIVGPKVLLVNELAGSGGDFFPWVFRQQKVGLLIGATTWGGLVKSSVHYALVDGGALTAPDNAVFDPINNKWVAENEGVAPDIFVRQDAKSLSIGIDPQLERAVKELLNQLKQGGSTDIVHPAYPKPAVKK